MVAAERQAGSQQMQDHKAKLADYIATLERSAVGTTRAEDRPRYQQHLAAAALMFAALEQHRSLDRLKELVASERRAYGWGMLSDAAGAAAERAFNTFADFVESR